MMTACIQVRNSLLAMIKLSWWYSAYTVAISELKILITLNTTFPIDDFMH